MTDNVFLFSLLLVYFLVPPELRGRVIVIGIAGARSMRWSTSSWAASGT